MVDMNRTKNTFNIILGILTSIIILAVMFFAAYYMEAEIHHECTGEDCPICAEIEMLQNAVRQIGTGVIYIVVVVMVYDSLTASVLTEYVDVCINTLVGDRVRLNI